MRTRPPSPPSATVGGTAFRWEMGARRLCLVVAEFGDARREYSRAVGPPQCGYCSSRAEHPLVATIDARTGELHVGCSEALSPT